MLCLSSSSVSVPGLICRFLPAASAQPGHGHSTATATKRLKAEGIEGHVEEVCIGWISGSAPASEQESVKHHLRTFHTGGTAQEWSCVVTGVINVEFGALFCSTKMGIWQRLQAQKLRRCFVPGQIHTPPAPSYGCSNSDLKLWGLKPQTHPNPKPMFGEGLASERVHQALSLTVDRCSSRFALVPVDERQGV